MVFKELVDLNGLYLTNIMPVILNGKFIKIFQK